MRVLSRGGVPFHISSGEVMANQPSVDWTTNISQSSLRTMLKESRTAAPQMPRSARPCSQ